jgi:ABC-2 type transport system permease protein
MKSSFIGDLRVSITRPEFWAYSSWLDIVTKYRRTLLGMFWMFMPPLAFILGLGYVYSRLLGHPPAEYMPYLGTGWVLWRFIIQVINEAAGVLRNHKAYIMEGRSTLTDFVLRVLAKASLYFVFAMVVVIGVLLWSPAMHDIKVLTLVLTLPIFALNMLWLAVFIALFGARYPDTTEFVNTILIFAFLLTPILWYPHQAPGGSMFGLLIRFNPAFHLIQLVRAPLLGQSIELFTIQFIAATTLIGGLLAQWLYSRYSRFVPLWI